MTKRQVRSIEERLNALEAEKERLATRRAEEERRRLLRSWETDETHGPIVKIFNGVTGRKRSALKRGDTLQVDVLDRALAPLEEYLRDAGMFE